MKHSRIGARNGNAGAGLQPDTEQEREVLSRLLSAQKEEPKMGRDLQCLLVGGNGLEPLTLSV